jgi:hypothetical protein
MRVLGAAAALVLLGSAGAYAQVFVAEPAPVYVTPAPTYSPAPVYVAPAPTYSPAPVVVAPPAVVAPPPAVGSAYAAAPLYSGSTIVDARTGRSCTIKPDGYRWCWTP